MEERPDKLSYVFALLLAGLALYTLVSLLTSSAADSGTLTYPSVAEVSNQCGRFGAVLSEKLLFTFGYGAYALVLVMLGWAVVLGARAPLPDVWARILGSSLIVLCVATVASMRGPLVHEAMPGYGGLIGEATAIYLKAKFGAVGTLLMAAMVSSISLVLATETLLVQGAQRLNGVVSEALERWNDERRRRFAELRERMEDERLRREERRAHKDAERALKRAEREAEAEVRRAEREADRARRAEEREEARARAAEDALQAKERKKEELARKKAEAETAARLAAKTKAAMQAAEAIAPKSRKSKKKKESRQATAIAPARGQSRSAKLLADMPKPPKDGPYMLPVPELLVAPQESGRSHRNLALEEKAELLENAFEQFNIQAKVVRISQGPTIAQFECELGAGIKLSKVTALSNDLAMAMQATSVRIVAPLPGKGTFGVEIPNDSRELVRFRELLESGAAEDMACPLILGKNIEGSTLADDLARMPHLLIAGTTGSGKSFCVNAIIVSLLYHKSPEDLKLILVDPKQVELAPFSTIPHLIAPTVTDPEKAAGVLNWAVGEMEKRYHIFKTVGCRSIETYRNFSEAERLERWCAAGEDPDDDPGTMPYIVIIVDELADLMYTAGKEVEGSIVRLAQKSRAAGLHLVLATQRPSVDVVTGLIKANLPCRLSFRVNSSHDSKVILDSVGADKLLGKGDMLYRTPARAGLIRAQGAFLADEEVARVVAFCAQQGKPQFHEGLQGPRLTVGSAKDEDPLFNDAVRIVLEQQRGSASLLQRALAIGYTRASRLIDIMEDKGILGPHKGSKAREILVTLEEWDEMMAAATEG